MRLHYRVLDNQIEIIRCFGNDTKVVLPRRIENMPVTKVAPYAFSDRKAENDEEVRVYGGRENMMFTGEEHLLAGLYVEEIVFPDTVSEIGKYIFYGCKGLTRLEFSNTLMHIGGGAFTGCVGLKALTVHMKDREQSCVKEILGDLWQRIDVTFCYEDGKKAVLVFPEHYEEAVENTPARLLYTQHHGSGNNYRQCFYNKEMDYRKYDSLFSVAAARDKTEVLADMAFGRLEFPYRLAENDKASYEALIRERYREMMDYLINKESFSMIQVISANSLWSPAMLDYAVEIAARKGKMEILSYLMNEKQKNDMQTPFKRARKTFEL